jgi:hypothetical protein
MSSAPFALLDHHYVPSTPIEQTAHLVGPLTLSLRRLLLNGCHCRHSRTYCYYHPLNISPNATGAATACRLIGFQVEIFYAHEHRSTVAR